MAIEIVERGQEANAHCSHIEHSQTPNKGQRHWHRLQQYCHSVFDLAQFKPLQAALLVNAQSQDQYNQAAISLVSQYFCAITHIREDLHKLAATDRLEVTSHLPEEEEAWLRGIATPKQQEYILEQARRKLEKARFAIGDEEVSLSDGNQKALYRALDLWLETH
ncbi:hypothetical protein ACH42_00895 [Endozoicomonas sp. (ex Bugula neritina AB1)]|nr:hypothetical protein ACH42_00895 [Endozoicomonas sp. (ex Bugula neritina AB1)]